MKPTLKVHNDLSTLGTNNVQSLNPLSPKEIWLKKEKELKLKGVILIFLTQVFWLIIFFAGDNTPAVSTPTLGIEESHEIIKLPAEIYIQAPRQGQKVAVSLFQEGSERMINGYLRGHEEDPLGDSGIKAILEIPSQKLHLIKNQKKTWKVFPPMITKHQNQRSIYEINF